MPTYYKGKDIYDIPDNIVSQFLKDNPDAIRAISYKTKDGIYDIPENEVQGFTQQYPDAKPLQISNTANKQQQIADAQKQIERLTASLPMTSDVGRQNINKSIQHWQNRIAFLEDGLDPTERAAYQTGKETAGKMFSGVQEVLGDIAKYGFTMLTGIVLDDKPKDTKKQESNIVSKAITAVGTGAMNLVASPVTAIAPDTKFAKMVNGFSQGVQASGKNQFEQMFIGSMMSVPMTVGIALNPAVGTSLILSSVYGQNIQDAIDRKGLDNSSMLTKRDKAIELTKAVVETGIEFASDITQVKAIRSMIKGLPQAKQMSVVAKYLKGQLGTKGFTTAVLGGGLTEGGEEVIQYWSNYLIDIATGNDEIRDANRLTKDSIQAFLGGAMGGLMLGGVGGGANLAIQNKAWNDIQSKAKSGDVEKSKILEIRDLIQQEKPQEAKQAFDKWMDANTEVKTDKKGKQYRDFKTQPDENTTVAIANLTDIFANIGQILDTKPVEEAINIEHPDIADTKTVIDAEQAVAQTQDMTFAQRKDEIMSRISGIEDKTSPEFKSAVKELDTLIQDIKKKQGDDNAKEVQTETQAQEEINLAAQDGGGVTNPVATDGSQPITQPVTQESVTQPTETKQPRTVKKSLTVENAQNVTKAQPTEQKQPKVVKTKPSVAKTEQVKAENAETIEQKPKLVKTEWKATVDFQTGKKVSTWEDAEHSEISGKDVVHVYWIEHNGETKPYGIKSASKMLGIKEQSLRTKANADLRKLQYDKQIRKQEKKLNQNNIEKNISHTATNAKTYAKWNLNIWNENINNYNPERLAKELNVVEYKGKYTLAMDEEASDYVEIGAINHGKVNDILQATPEAKPEPKPVQKKTVTEVKVAPLQIKKPTKEQLSFRDDTTYQINALTDEVKDLHKQIAKETDAKAKKMMQDKAHKTQAEIIKLQKSIEDINLQERVDIFNKLGEAFGIPINIVQAPAQIRGFYKDGVLYYNANSNADPAWVFGHEFTHHLKDNNPELYKELLGTVVIEQAEIEDYRSLSPEYYGKLTDAEIKEEILGDRIGDYRDIFFNEIKSSNPSLFKKIVEAIKSLLSSLKGESKTQLEETLPKVLRKAIGITAKNDASDIRYSLSTEETEMLKELLKLRRDVEVMVKEYKKDNPIRRKGDKDSATKLKVKEMLKTRYDGEIETDYDPKTNQEQADILTAMSLDDIISILQGKKAMPKGLLKSSIIKYVPFFLQNHPNLPNYNDIIDIYLKSDIFKKGVTLEAQELQNMRNKAIVDISSVMKMLTTDIDNRKKENEPEVKKQSVVMANTYTENTDDFDKQDTDAFLELVKAKLKQKQKPVKVANAKLSINDDMITYRQKVKDGSITPNKLINMSESEQTAFFEKFVSKENAPIFAEVWRNDFQGKYAQKADAKVSEKLYGNNKRKKKDFVERVAGMRNVLYQSEQPDIFNNDWFNRELAYHKLGFYVSKEEAGNLFKQATIVIEKKELWDNDKLADPNEYGIERVKFYRMVGEISDRSGRKSAKEYFQMSNIGEIFMDFADMTMASAGGFDYSPIGRQAAPAWWRYPKTLLRVTGKTFSAYIETFKGINAKDKIMAMMISDKTSLLMDKAGLAYLTGEENFPTDRLEKIPYFGRFYKAHQDFFLIFIHLARFHIFKEMLSKANKLNASGKIKIDINNENELLAIGTIVNSLTGRGSWATTKRGVIPSAIRLVFWSPGLIKSKLDTLTGHVFDPKIQNIYKKGDKKISNFTRNEAAYNLVASVVGLASMMLFIRGIAEAFGLDPDDIIELDPRSSDWGKLKIHDTRIDLTGGAGQYVILAARIISAAFGWEAIKSTETGILRKIHEPGYGKQTAWDLLTNAAENKYSPVMSLIKNWAKGTMFTGERTTLVRQAVSVSPIVIRNIVQAAQDPKEYERWFGTITDIFGVGSNTYSFGTNWDTVSSEEMTKLREGIKTRADMKRYRTANDNENKYFAEELNKLRSKPEWKELPEKEKMQRVIEIRKKSRRRAMYEYRKKK